MTSRLLPWLEWEKLEGTELAEVWPYLDPATAQVLVVEDEGTLVGCWAVFPVWHCEGLWIAPAARKRASVARRLWVGVQAMAATLGIQRLATASVSEDVSQLLAHVRATPVPGQHFVMEMPVCRPR